MWSLSVFVEQINTLVLVTSEAFGWLMWAHFGIKTMSLNFSYSHEYLTRHLTLYSAYFILALQYKVKGVLRDVVNHNAFFRNSSKVQRRKKPQ